MMKTRNLFFTGLIVLGSFLAAPGQTEKGKFLLGGNSNLLFYTNKYHWDENDPSGRSWDISFAPQVGYFVTDGLAAGMEFPFRHIWGDDEKITSISCGPFLRYYFGKTQFKPYLTAGTEFGKSVSEYTYSNEEASKTTDRTFAYRLGGGLGIFITKNISVDLGLLYIHEKYRSKYEDNEPNKMNSKGLAVDIGFVLVL
ncbi:MAG: outer membrane beta-barrel protein [Mangrovibacterium sp.]